MAAVPFHFYAPDVYQGTTHANAAVLSVVPKAASLIVLVRLMPTAISPGAAADGTIWRIALALAVLSMSFGNVLALWQQNLRRLLAYSSIAQAGYLLVGLTVLAATGGAAESWNAVTAILFYLAVYAAAIIGTFAVLAWLGHEERQIDSVDELIGLGRMRPAAAAMLAVFMFSLTGIPPLAGFWGKLLIFGNALSVDAGVTGGSRQPWFVALAVIGVLNAAVSAAYYLRIVAVMYFRTPLATPKARGGLGAWLAAAVCTLLVVALGLYPRPLLQEAERVQGSGFRVQDVDARVQGSGFRVQDFDTLVSEPVKRRSSAHALSAHPEPRTLNPEPSFLNPEPSSGVRHPLLLLP
jgi:NADH-quinone oxidoreductase subunit N